MVSDVGYCTVEDVRRALRNNGLPGDAAQDRDIVLDAITGQKEWLHETTNRHWYETGGISEDSDGIIPTGPLTHTEDEQDIPTKAFLTTERKSRARGLVFGRNPVDDPAESGGLAPREFRGSFTRVTLFRRDVQNITELLVLTTTGYEDWVSGSQTEGRAGDYYLHVHDSNGLSRLYLDTDSLDPDLENYSAAVVVSYEWGIDGLSNTVRRAVALRAAADLTNEAAIQIPENSRLRSVDALAEEMREKATELLDIHM